MKRKVLSLAVLALMIGSTSCNKEIEGGDVSDGEGNELELASDKLLGGVDVDIDTLYCISRISITTRTSIINDTLPDLVETYASYDSDGISTFQLNLIRKNEHDLNITDTKFEDANHFTTTYVGVDDLSVGLIEYSGWLNESMFWYGFYDANYPPPSIGVEIVTMNNFDSYYNNIDTTTIDNNNISAFNTFKENYNSGEIENNTDIVIRIKTTDETDIHSIEKISYYTYRR